MINILWDLDGTLIDSMPIIEKCLNKTAKHYGVKPWNEVDLRPLIGPELGIILSTILVIEEPDQIDQAKDIYRSFYELEMLNSPVFTGILDTLTHFQHIGAKQFVATAKYQQYAQQIIEAAGLAVFFTGIYGSTKDGKYGDKKELLELIIAEEALKPADTIMIGDTRYDVEAGRHHDLTALGVLWGYSDKETLNQAGAHDCVVLPGDIAGVIKSSVMCVS